MRHCMYTLGPVVLVLAAGCQSPQDEVRAQVRSLGGSVEQDGKSGAVVAIDLHGSTVTDDWLARLGIFSQLRRLDLGSTAITGAGFARLENLTELEALNLSGCRELTDAGLAHVTAYSHLHELGLGGTPITDAGLRPLRALKALRRLNLHGTKVTAAGVAALRKALPDVDVQR